MDESRLETKSARAWTPVLVQHVEIEGLGFRLHRLQLNRHQGDEVRRHRHSHAQLLVYLTGEGRQTVQRQAAVPVAPGSFFLIPPGAEHGFHSGRRSRPLCLAVDFTSREREFGIRAHGYLPQRALNELHRLVTALPSHGRLNLHHYALALELLARLLELCRKAPAEGATLLTLEARLEAMLRRPGMIGLPLKDLSHRAGYHPDYLSRRLRRRTGLSFGEWRDRIRLEIAQAAMNSGYRAGDAATEAGFTDASYFSRWFRRKTGMPPLRWKGKNL